MKLQFFHVEDLCRVIKRIMEIKPEQHIFNVGNEELVTVNTFVLLCYKIAEKSLKLEYVNRYNDNQREYFCFHNYEYCLDLERQKQLIHTTKELEKGLRESFEWYMNHPKEVVKRNYTDYIDHYLKKS